jgi:hypothetical protein
MTDRRSSRRGSEDTIGPGNYQDFQRFSRTRCNGVRCRARYQGNRCSDNEMFRACPVLPIGPERLDPVNVGSRGEEGPVLRVADPQEAGEGGETDPGGPGRLPAPAPTASSIRHEPVHQRFSQATPSLSRSSLEFVQ